MKTKEEILEYHLPKRYYGHEARKNSLRAMTEVENQTREEMFEFIDWMHDNTDDTRIEDGILWYAIPLEDWIGIKELFDYWKQLKK